MRADTATNASVDANKKQQTVANSDSGVATNGFDNRQHHDRITFSEPQQQQQWYSQQQPPVRAGASFYRPVQVMVPPLVFPWPYMPGVATTATIAQPFGGQCYCCDEYKQWHSKDNRMGRPPHNYHCRNRLGKTRTRKKK